MQELIAKVTPLLRTAGFQGRSRTFERRRGQVTQLVSFQSSHGGDLFYVNVGLVFDAVSALGGDTTGSVRIGSHVVHFSARLHELVAGLPDRWNVLDARAQDQLRAGCEAVIAILDRVEGPDGMLATVSLDKGFQKVLRAQLKWTTSDRSGARADLEAVAREFSDRRGCSVGELAKNAGLQL